MGQALLVFAGVFAAILTAQCGSENDSILVGSPENCNQEEAESGQEAEEVMSRPESEGVCRRDSCPPRGAQSFLLRLQLTD